MGGRAGLQGRADPDLGQPAVRPRESGVFPGLLRRGEGHLQRCRRRDHRAVDAFAGAVGGGASGL
jgi:hypothetical protein